MTVSGIVHLYSVHARWCTVAIASCNECLYHLHPVLLSSPCQLYEYWFINCTHISSHQKPLNQGQHVFTDRLCNIMPNNRLY